MAKKKKLRREVIVLPQAESSIDQIALYYITEFTIERTEKVLNSIYQAIEFAAQHPFGHLRLFNDGITEPNIRKAVVHKTFKIIFEVFDDRIEILDVFHGSRNPKLLIKVIEERKKAEE